MRFFSDQLLAEDYYRDTAHSRGASRATNFVPMPQLSFAYGGGPGSAYGGSHAGSEFGYPTGFAANQPQPVGYRNSQMSLGSMGAPYVPQRQSGMSGFSNFPSFLPTQGSVYSMNPFLPATPSPLAGSQNPEPSDEELANTLRYAIVFLTYGC